MIEHDKHATFDAWFCNHARSRIRKSFQTVRIRGEKSLAESLGESPVLAICNHTSWWDPLVLLYLTRFHLRADGYALMDAKNLRRLPFFRKVGAFGVDLDSAVDGAHAIRYAAKLLARPGRVVWLFPQGRERPITAPIEFRPGSAEIAKISKKALVVPVALRYEFGKAELPELWVSIGVPLSRSKNCEDIRASQEDAVRAELRNIDEAIVTQSANSFETVETRAQDFASGFGEKMLAMLTS